MNENDFKSQVADMQRRLTELESIRASIPPDDLAAFDEALDDLREKLHVLSSVERPKLN